MVLEDYIIWVYVNYSLVYVESLYIQVQSNDVIYWILDNVSTKELHDLETWKCDTNASPRTYVFVRKKK